jgi:predicted NBD/HSP70 family sugar kinase
LRGLNSINALSHVLALGPSTATQISTGVGVSRTAVEAVLADLVASGWLARLAPQSTAQPGRPGASYDLAAEVGAIGALQFDSARVAATVCDYRGDPLVALAEDLQEDLPVNRRVDAGVELFGRALGASAVAPGSVRLVGVASPGVISGGRVLHFGGHGMPGWIGTDLGGNLRRALGLPVVVEGDSALGALAEKRRGAAQDRDNFVYIYSGRRTGAAIMLDGKLRRGAHGAVGLVGELDELRWKEVEEAAYRSAGPGGAANVQAEFPAVLGLGISAMVLAVDPDAVLIGGPYRDHIQAAMEEITLEVARRCPIPPTVQLGRFGADAVIQGTVCLAMDAIADGLVRLVEAGAPMPGPGALAQAISHGL